MNAKLLMLPVLMAAVLLLAGCTSSPLGPSCPSSCDDNNTCTQDYCNASTNGTCAHTSFDGFSCNNASGICKAGVCVNKVVVTSTGSSDNRYEFRKSDSDSYWRSARPWQVLEHAQPANGDLTLVILNVDSAQLKLTNLSVEGNGFAGSYTTPAYLSSGDSKAITVHWNTKGVCNAGDTYEYHLEFSYDSTGASPIINQKQYGAKNIVGKCS